MYSSFHKQKKIKKVMIDFLKMNYMKRRRQKYLVEYPKYLFDVFYSRLFSLPPHHQCAEFLAKNVK
jgi:hypothetical protein